MGRRYLYGPASSGSTLNTITPCAACKLLRRCAEECPFSPYFSPHEPQKFAAVHKVFGASNVSKLLMEVPESQRADAANSLVLEANLRLRDPVYGCMGAISALQQQVQSLQAEVNAVRAEILRYKYREAATTGHYMISSHAALVSSGEGTILAQPQQAIPQQPPHPPPPSTPKNLSPLSTVLPTLSSSSTSSLYSPASSTTAGPVPIPNNDSIPYFV